MKNSILFILLIVTVFVYADIPDWEVITGTQYSFVLISHITFQGNTFSDAENNIFAAFGADESDCRAIGIWYDGNPGYWYMTVLGDLNGETISFKIYNSADDTIYDCNQQIAFENNATIGTPAEPFQISTTMTGVSGNISLMDTNNTNGTLSDVVINVDNQNYFPNQSGLFEIPLEEGIYQAEISLENYASVFPTFSVIEGDISEYDFKLIDWSPISGNQYNMNVSLNVELSGSAVIQNGVNQVAAFGNGGATDCRGVAVWEEANPPYWNGYWFITIVGSTQDETITFKYFDHENQAIINLNETITFDNDASIGTPENPLVLSILSNQEIELNQNWNWVSFFIDFEDPELSNVFEQIENQVFQIKSQNQSATFYNPPGSWIGDLDEIAIGETYLIEMTESSTLNLEGSPVDLSTSIPLEEGWNWIGYFPQETRQIESVFQNITENVEQIKSQNQSAIYYNPPGTWVGDLEEMNSGNGYKLKMSESDELVYSNRINQNVMVESKTTRDFPDWEVIGGTQYSFVLMADVIFDDEEFTYNENNAFAAFGEDGTCRGIAIGVEPTDNWDGCWYMTVVGNTQDEEISFKIYDDETDTIYDCDETLTFSDNETYGSPQNEIEFHASSDDIQEDAIIQTNLSNFPNPFNPTTTIAFDIPKNTKSIALEIFNIKGQLIKNFEISPSEKKGSVIWNGTDNNNNPACSGIYFVKLQLDNNFTTKRILLLK